MRARDDDMATLRATARDGPASAQVDIGDIDSPDALRAALDAVGWRVDAIARALPRLQALPGLFDPRERCAWLGVFRRAYPRLDGLAPSARERLLALLQTWCDWPLYLALREAADDAGDRDMVDALLRIGRLDAAEERCRARLLAHPHDSGSAAMHEHLQRWRWFVRARAGAIADEALRLEPLGHHHCDEFAWQYWDPDIAQRCCLPTFRDAAHWHAWLDECWGYGDQFLYAVLHPVWGFVGSVSLTLHDATGFFYYWIGRDFQGHGIGPAAVRLLLGDAFERRGMTSCYAKVYASNAASRKALSRIGFEPLDFAPAPPNDDEMFYRLGPAQAREYSAEALRALFGKMGSNTRVAMPWRPLDAVPTCRHFPPFSNPPPDHGN